MTSLVRRANYEILIHGVSWTGIENPLGERMECERKKENIDVRRSSIANSKMGL